MHFIVLGYDGKDEKAIDRRMTVRNDHLSLAQELLQNGKWCYAAGILDDDKKMIGSMIVCDFESKDAMHKEWLDKEPYILGKVWDKIIIHPAQIPPFILNK